MTIKDVFKEINTKRSKLDNSFEALDSLIDKSISKLENAQFITKDEKVIDLVLEALATLTKAVEIYGNK